METWPSSTGKLPDVSYAQFAHEENPGVRRTEMESGLVRQVRRFTASRRLFNVAWRMTQQQYEAFQAWHKFKVSCGADFFNIDLPIACATYMDTVLARFLNGKYQASHVEGYWDVTATLETYDDPSMTLGELNTYLS